MGDCSQISHEDPVIMGIPTLVHLLNSIGEILLWVFINQECIVHCGGDVILFRREVDCINLSIPSLTKYLSSFLTGSLYPTTFSTVSMTLVILSSKVYPLGFVKIVK